MSIGRKNNEWTILTLEDGRTIRVGVGKIEGNRVRLFFDCDRSIAIMREELTRTVFDSQYEPEGE